MWVAGREIVEDDIKHAQQAHDGIEGILPVLLLAKAILDLALELVGQARAVGSRPGLYGRGVA